MLKCIFAKNIVNKSYKLNKISLLFFLEITVAKKKKNDDEEEEEGRMDLQ